MKANRPSSTRVRLYDDDLPFPPRPRRTEIDKYGDLTAIEERFCQHYTSYYQASGAAIWAGYIPVRAHITAHRLLKDPRIKRRVVSIEADRLRRLKFDGDVFLASEVMLAQADVTELVETWIPPCRYCWGRNNEYQRTHAELQEDFETWMRLPDQRKMRRAPSVTTSYGETLVYDSSGSKIPFDQRGGDGYDPSQPPNPACPNCHGRGSEHPQQGTIPYIRMKDSRYLSDVGRMLYAGAEYTPKGVKQLMHSRDAARGRLMGMMGKFLELRADNPSAVKSPTLGFQMGIVPEVADLLTDDPASMSDPQLDSLLAQYGVTIDGSGGEGTDSEPNSGEAPPPGSIA